MMQQPPPFQLPPSLLPKPKKVRSRVLTVMLWIRLISDLFIVGLGAIAYTTLGSQSDVTIPRAQAQRLANILLVVMVVAFVELLGVVGMFNFKKWGAYVLLGFSAINIMSNLSAGNRWSALITLITTLVIGGGVYPRWSDYE